MVVLAKNRSGSESHHFEGTPNPAPTPDASNGGPEAEMLLIGHIALAAWTSRHAALAVHPASRSRPVIVAAEVSVAAAAEVRRDDESAGASLPASLPLTAHDLRTGPCSYSLATLALTHPPPLPVRRPAGASPRAVPSASLKMRQLIPRVRRAQGRSRRLARRLVTTRRRSTGKTRALR